MGALEWCKAGLVDFKGLDGLGGPQRVEGRGPEVPCLVLTQCASQDWDNRNQNEAVVLSMDTLEWCKAGLDDF